MNNFERLKNVMGTVLEVDSNEISESSSMDTIESWDSLKHLNIVLALEEEFDISFSDEESIIIVNLAIIKSVLSDHGVSFS